MHISVHLSVSQVSHEAMQVGGVAQGGQDEGCSRVGEVGTAEQARLPKGPVLLLLRRVSVTAAARPSFSRPSVCRGRGRRQGGEKIGVHTRCQTCRVKIQQISHVEAEDTKTSVSPTPLDIGCYSIFRNRKCRVTCYRRVINVWLYCQQMRGLQQRCTSFMHPMEDSQQFIEG